MASSDPAPFLHSLKLTTAPSNSSRSTILTSALTTSLTTLGYDPSLIQRVALLSASNTHTVECNGLQALLYHPSRTYGAQHALAKLFEDIKAKDVRINSNEPVLLINSLGGLDRGMLQEITDAVAGVLRYFYHIRPVRIYAGNFTPVVSEEKDAGYSISLLSVVNTDIGGPGMVQLIDMADWKGKGAVRMEHWDGSGWNMLYRRDYDVGHEMIEQETASEAGRSEAGEWESGPEEKEDEEMTMEKEDINVAVPDVPESLQNTGGSEPDPVDAPEKVEVISDLSADNPWSQRLQLRDIKHPSWEREHDNESLLDMISKQAQRIPISKSGNAYATGATKEKAGLSGEDEYEVV